PSLHDALPISSACSRRAPGGACSRRAPSNGLEIHFISNKHCESHFSSAKTTQKKSCFLRAITAMQIRRTKLTDGVKVDASRYLYIGRNERHALAILTA